ncbi:NADP-dependent succinic semialdehyde dehydrogenase [Candidatus Microgenomates bacterium]|nr:NAD-dependent succinate-semialdehyde dehydrogenase [Candidatus Microgenomates bacterium CPR3]RIK52042.1 MAG: NADP-dependent succinic semialdehyde dehydrogenase [Candidatus Microgenomates bacterium]
MNFTSINPTTGKVIKEYEYLTPDQIQTKLELAETGYKTWSQTPLKSRIKLLKKLATNLLAKKSDFANLMTLEMGKRTVDGIAEIEKCAWVCQYYAENAEKILKPKTVKTDADESYVRYDPLGVTLAIMPWNFPFWQVFRAAAPALVAGNSMLLKHASSVPACALAIEDLFIQSGAPLGTFQTLLVDSSSIKHVISHPSIHKISLTGSENAGISVASLAGQHLKPTVLELGGSDPFIILPDCNLDLALQAASTSRLLVAGQSCIAAKRFIVHKNLYEAFIEGFTKILSSKKLGDPSNPETDIGPLINREALVALDRQVKQSLDAGAKLILGGKLLDSTGYFYPPTILSDVTPEMPVFAEETFGPVAAISIFSELDEALKLANHPHFGLGASVWTNNKNVINFFAQKLESGSVFVNSLVKSDPRLPFGGTKYSGYGRELASEGLYEYTNIKTVWIN